MLLSFSSRSKLFAYGTLVVIGELRVITVLWFWVGKPVEGTAPLLSDLIETYEAHQGLIP